MVAIIEEPPSCCWERPKEGKSFSWQFRRRRFKTGIECDLLDDGPNGRAMPADFEAGTQSSHASGTSRELSFIAWSVPTNERERSSPHLRDDPMSRVEMWSRSNAFSLASARPYIFSAFARWSFFLLRSLAVRGTTVVSADVFSDHSRHVDQSNQNSKEPMVLPTANRRILSVGYS